MPVKTEKRDGKYRVVDPDGSITKNNSGTAVDGGGHDTKEEALSQVRAINISMSRRALSYPARTSRLADRLFASAKPRIFRKKPILVETVRYDGLNFDEVKEFAPSVSEASGGIPIPTLEGDMRASPGDWIVKGVKGEFWAVKPEVFRLTYEPTSTSEGS